MHRCTSQGETLLSCLILPRDFLFIQADICSSLRFSSEFIGHIFPLLVSIMSADEMPEHTAWHYSIRLGLVRFFYPCLMLFGTIGNILCLKILLRKRFRRQSTCQYLCVLAVIDILFIYMRSSRYLYRYIFDVDLRNTSRWMCRSFIFFSSTLSHLASWILVVVSFDRYFIMKNLFPRRHAGWRVFKSTIALIVIICLLNAHYFHILGKDRFDRLGCARLFASSQGTR